MEIQNSSGHCLSFYINCSNIVSEEVNLCRFASTQRKHDHNARVEWNHTHFFIEFSLRVETIKR